MTKKRTANDAFGRMQHAANTNTNTNTTSGRGSEAGWTKCPLCPSDTNKVFAMGRGLAAHLNSVHTPWNPSAKELKRRRKAKDSVAMRGVSRKKKRKLEAKQPHQGQGHNKSDTEKWEPTKEEVDAWNAQVLEYTTNAVPIIAPKANTEDEDSNNAIMVRYDRTGNVQQTTYASLSPFIQAAADGNLKVLQQQIMICDADAYGGRSSKDGGRNSNIMKLMDKVDRNGSTAEHWAAGGGHAACLEYLMTLRCKYSCRDTATTTGDDAAKIMIMEEEDRRPKKKVRRRDGKTTLHYAARYGRNNCIKLIIERARAIMSSSSSLHKSSLFDVDKPSGDGSTALHLACYGGYLDTVQLLVDQYGADIHRSNAWGCTAAHWTCMSVASSLSSSSCDNNIAVDTTVTTDCSKELNCEQNNDQPKPKVLQLLHCLKFKHKLPFHQAQSQGHTPLHKAALKRNEYVIEWLWENMTKEERVAITVDEGGHMPSDIYASVGGKQEFVKWMRDICRW